MASRVLRQYSILAFCMVYIAMQAFCIISAHWKADKRFGFWMFAESSRYRAQLYRQLSDGRLVKTRHGQWAVTTKTGQKVYTWDRFVRDFRLNNLEQLKRAKVGLAVTLTYLHYALNYVLDRIPEDHETVKLVLQIQYRKAQGPWKQTMIESRVRDFTPILSH